MSRFSFSPYVRQADRKKNAAKETAKMQKKGVRVSPVFIEGRTIVKSVWGKAWCEALESHADFDNRLTRGRTYVRNGSVVHLDITKLKVCSKVYGSSMYDVQIDFDPLSSENWSFIKKSCEGQISSLVNLLAGRIPDTVMAAVSQRNKGLFPDPGHMKFHCSCPDWASLCKHVAAALYGIGARLDSQPDLLFTLRGVDYRELIPAVKTIVGTAVQSSLSDINLEDVFGIHIEPVQEEKNKSLKIPAKIKRILGAEKRPAALNTAKKMAKIAAQSPVKIKITK